jgi:hypothetical protein
LCSIQIFQGLQHLHKERGKAPNQLTQFTKETNKLKSKYTNLHCSGRAGKKQKPAAAQEVSGQL